MKILVFSDSHGNVDNMVRAVEIQRPDRIFHLGDGWRDAEALHAMFPKIPLEQVMGNCDFCTGGAVEKRLTIQGKKLLLCHGHTYRVKEGLLDALYAAREAGVDLFLFGHTHVATQERDGSLLLLNPGSIGYWGAPSYALVKLEDGRLTADLQRLA